MPGITFSEGSGLQDSIYGKCQAPIRFFLEKRGESFEQKSLIPVLFSVEKSTHALERTTEMTSMKGFQPVGENGEYPVDTMQEGFSKTFSHEVWKNSFPISREMVDDAILMNLKGKPAAFIAGYYRTREKFGAALYGGAVANATEVKFRGKKYSVKTADEKNLFAKDHPSATDEKFVQSNCFQDEFSEDALGAMESKMQDFRDDNGEVLDVTPNTIIIPNDHKLKKLVFATIGADKDPDTANNGFNYLFGRWRVVVWQYLNQFISTKGTLPWILADMDYSAENQGALWLDRVPLEVESTKASNDANVWKGYARFTAGFNDWRFAAVGGCTGGDTLVSA